MLKLVKSGETAALTWTVAEKGTLPDAADLSSHLLHVNTYSDKLDELNGAVTGIWFAADDDTHALKGKLAGITTIGIEFPVFSDGRGFSIARQLRDSLGYEGELLALGGYMQDQLFYLMRCGFDAFALAEGANVESMKESLKDFSDSYQAAVDEPRPLFRRR